MACRMGPAAVTGSAGTNGPGPVAARDVPLVREDDEMPALCTPGSGRRGHPAGPFLLVLIAAVLLAAACSSPGKPAPAGPSATAASAGPAKTVVPPGTPAGAQLRWLLAAVARLPISDAQVRAHFAAALLAGNPARAINLVFPSFAVAEGPGLAA